MKRKRAGEAVRKWGGKNVERVGGGGGREIRYEEVGGIWVAMEISLACFPLSSPALLYLSSAPPLSARAPESVLWAGPARSPGGPIQRGWAFFIPRTTSGSVGLFWQGRLQ